MIENFAETVIGKLIEYKYITATQKEDYVYALIMTMETWISLTAIMLVGICLQVFMPTLFFLVCLFAIKKRSGGFHAKKFGICFFATVSTYIGFVIFLMPIMEKEINMTYIVLAIAMVVLEIIGAVNHPNMNWSMEEYKESKSAARMVVAMEGMVIVFLICLGADKEIIVSMAFAVILSAILLLLAKICKQEVSQ